MTHQEIADRLEAISEEHLARQRAIADADEPEREALQAECAAIGHVYKPHPYTAVLKPNPRICAICNAWEQK